MRRLAATRPPAGSFHSAAQTLIYVRQLAFNFRVSNLGAATSLFIICSDEAAAGRRDDGGFPSQRLMPEPQVLGWPEPPTEGHTNKTPAPPPAPGPESRHLDPPPASLDFTCKTKKLCLARLGHTPFLDQNLSWRLHIISSSVPSPRADLCRYVSKLALGLSL